MAKDFIKDRLDKGVRIGISVDIRKVENFFKKLFGSKDKKEKKDGKKKTRRTS